VRHQARPIKGGNIQDGGKRTVYEVEADEIGPSLRNATAKVEKVTRANGAEIATATDEWGPASTRAPMSHGAVLALSDEMPARAFPAGRALRSI
jgi:single-strand DNA-binding protein